MQYGFHEGRVDDEFEKLWLEHVAADAVECRGAWLPEDAYGAGPIPVATTSWFDKTLHCGRELLPLRMVTDVTTSPTHRRKGLVRRLMEDCLAEAAADGVPMAALTVSEATIYGRWGYGAATFAPDVEVDAGPRFGLRDFTDPGRVELVDPRTSWDLIRGQIDRYHQRTRGSVGLPQFYEPMLTGHYHPREGGEDKQLRAAVHLTADETVDGIVLYKQDGRDDQGDRKVKITVLVSESPEGYLALWQFLGGIDLVRSAHVPRPRARGPDPLGAARHQRPQGQVRQRVPLGAGDRPAPRLRRPALECRRRDRARHRRRAGLRRGPLAGAHARRGGGDRRPRTESPSCRSTPRPSARSTSPASTSRLCTGPVGSPARPRAPGGSPRWPTCRTSRSTSSGSEEARRRLTAWDG